jgi:hypothetical protein
MGSRHRGDGHDVQLLAGEQVPVVLVDVLDAVLARQLLGPWAIAVADGYNLDARNLAEASDVQSPLKAAPNDPDPNGRISLELGHLIITLP